jgi:hypothetical protein
VRAGVLRAPWGRAHDAGDGDGRTRRAHDLNVGGTGAPADTGDGGPAPAGNVTGFSPPITAIEASSAPKPSPPAPGGAAPRAAIRAPMFRRCHQRLWQAVLQGDRSKHVVATWVGRGIRIDSRTNRAHPAAKTGCSSPTLIHVSEIRLTERRWVTSLGLRVGDTISKLRRLYPRSPYARARPGSSRNEYYLVWRHERCRGSCSQQAKRQGVNHPLLTAQVENGKVVALRATPVAPQPGARPPSSLHCRGSDCFAFGEPVRGNVLKGSTREADRESRCVNVS